MKVKVKKLNENAVIPFKTYEKDYCYDVVAVSEEEVAPNVWKYGIGLAFQIDRGGILEHSDAIISIDLRPRSSVWKTGMVFSNCEGTIDELYTGEVYAVFYHVFPNMERYKVGQRIGQIKIGITTPIEFVVVDELDETERNSGSYGSTGV